MARTRIRGSRAPCLGAAILLLAAPSMAPALGAQNTPRTVQVTGLLVDRGTDAPVRDAFVALDSTNHAVYTDADGRFRFDEIVPGTYTVRIRHIAYGNQTQALVVEPGRDIAVRLAVSQTAIELEPLVLEVFSRDELYERAAGFTTGIVTRAELERLENSTLNLGEVLRLNAPGVRVRRFEGMPGHPICIEFRMGARMSPGECRSPAVYLDGVPVFAPETLYGNLPLGDLERVEIVPAAEAGARFGNGAQYGAILIETRRPGLDRDDDAVGGEGESLLTNFDWTQDPSGHSTTRVFGFALAGGALGLTAGVLVADECLGLRDPTFDSVVSDCGGFATMGAAAAAVALPALGAALAARWAGGTDVSRGKLVPATLGASMVLIPGYALVLSSRQTEEGGVGAAELAGGAVLALGAPFVAALADKLYRSLRN